MNKEERKQARELRRRAMREEVKKIRLLRREAQDRHISRFGQSKYIKHRLTGKTSDEAMKLAMAEWHVPPHILSLQDEVAKLPEVSDDEGSSVRTISGGAFEMNRRKH